MRFYQGGKNCQTMFIIFIMPSSDVFHQWGDMIINYGTDNEAPDFETMIFHIGLAQNYIVAPWLVAQNYTPKWVGCKYERAGSQSERSKIFKRGSIRNI